MDLPPPGYPDFERLLGPDAWERLPESVRARFPCHHRAADVVHYSGAMRRVDASRFGRLFAKLARLVGTPVAPGVGRDVGVTVKVYRRSAVNGVTWERTYDFPGRAPVVVRSTKRLDEDGSLIEALGAGLRMQLEVFEDYGALHFVSTGYRIEVLGTVIRLPAWFPPGTTHVIHSDEGRGRFKFTLYTEHAWFGEMFFQEGSFEQISD